MSWFNYSYDGPKEKRSDRKNVYLRVRYDCNTDVLEQIKLSGLKRVYEVVHTIIVKELHKNNMVLLEIWCTSPSFKKLRYNVFYIEVKENPDWICEGDLGKGYIYRK